MTEWEWKYGPPDTRYVKWYRVEAQFNWKKKSFKKCVYAKWIPVRKVWVGYNHRVLNVIRWTNMGDWEIE